MSVNQQYQQLIKRLDDFIRRYYTNEIIRGSIFSIIYVLLFFLLINFLEYKFYFTPAIRKFLFYGFLISSLLFIYLFVIQPLMKFYQLGTIISHDKAAAIIGNHFTEVKDKLINILQLNKLSQLNEYQLVNASIMQKIDDLRTVSFSKAVDLNENKKYLKFLAIPLTLTLLVAIFSPKIFTEGTKRLIYNNTVFEKEAPFKFVVKNKVLSCNQGDNFLLQVTTNGDIIPDAVFIQTDKSLIKLKNVEQNLFEHEFINIQNSIPFYLSSGDFNSAEYKIDVTPKPAILSFDIVANYPAYVGKQNEVINSTGDLTVPQGTSLTWKFKTKHTDSMQFMMNGKTYQLQNKDNYFSFAAIASGSAAYSVLYKNKFASGYDSIAYSLQVIPDLYPTINVAEKRDTLNDNFFYYFGDISDDYGLKRLTFNYSVLNNEGKIRTSKVIDVPFNSGILSKFTFFWNIKDFAIQPGEKMNYFFEVWDNDGVHGSKSTKSILQQFAMPTEGEINKQNDAANQSVKNDFSQQIKDAKSIQDELKKMQESLLEKKQLAWEDKKKLNDLMDRQKNLEQELKDIKNKMSQNFDKQNDFKENTQSILEKEQKLKELFDNVLNDEMKKLFEKLEKMMDELSKKDALDKMQDMQMNNEKVEKELDRMLELFKKLEYEQKLNQTIEKIEKLAEKQEELANKTENGANADDAKNEQDELKKQTKEAIDDMKKLDELNKENKENEDNKEAGEQMDDAAQDQQNASDNLANKNNKQAGNKQKSAAQKLAKAAKKLNDMKQKMQEQDATEDMQATRQLLKNILKLSFDQESLMKEIKTTNTNTPKFVELMKRQQNIRENSLMVEDSLFALAKRVFQLKTFVTKQMTDVNKNLAKAIDELEERNVYKATGNQQSVMTGYNNLALMLNESLQQQQQQSQQNSDPKDGQPKNCSKCKNPGNGKPNMSQMQKQLNDKISKLGEQLKKEGQQNKPGRQNPNGQMPTSRNTMSKQFAQMAAEQAEMKRQLEKMANEMRSKGQQPGKSLTDAIKEMDKAETDLVNKHISNEMLQRQQEILVKLLEHEKAQQEQEEDKQRESKDGKITDRKVPPSLENYLKEKQAEVDMYRAVPPSLKPSYKTMTEIYFKNIAK